MKQMFNRTPIDKILHFKPHLTAILFSAQIIVPTQKLRSDSNALLKIPQIPLIHSVMMDTLEVVGIFRRSISKSYITVDYIVYL